MSVGIPVVIGRLHMRELARAFDPSAPPPDDVAGRLGLGSHPELATFDVFVR